jgi:enoyl-CoA hydratase/carnithine racemase
MGMLLNERLESLTGIALPATELRMNWLHGSDAMVVTKRVAGFDRATVETVAALLHMIEEERFPGLKFLIFDFSHGGEAVTRAVEGFHDMVAANAELIVDTPVITLAWVRASLSGLDFDFAMNCSAIVAETGAAFSLAGEPFDLLGLYASVGRRIGFGRAERLIERDATLTAEEAHDLLIVKDVVARLPRFEGISAYLAQFGRRYNSSHAIFRAQRMAEPPIDRRPVLGDLAERN